MTHPTEMIPYLHYFEDDETLFPVQWRVRSISAGHRSCKISIPKAPHLYVFTFEFLSIGYRGRLILNLLKVLTAIINSLYKLSPIEMSTVRPFNAWNPI